MAKFYDRLKDVLRKDERFFSRDGSFLREAVYDAAMNMDANLIKILLEDADMCSRFFTDINGVKVFDKVGFAWLINNQQFLPDSYTRFKNKIGLGDGNGNMISSSGYVELVFPYKDCVLEGGQTKEDQKRSEIFYNETLAPDEIDRLLEPKVFTKARRYTRDNIEEGITSFSEKDNLVIKGNNLLSIASLLKRFENKKEVKCVYIDVPYNTGNDGFNYNDRFNQSSWLCFMKNRLEIAHELLKKDGTIAISVDNYEIGYLLVLMDEIFGRENRKNIITVRRSSVSGAKVVNPGVVNIVEYVVIYSRDSENWKPNRVYQKKGYDNRYNQFILNFEDGYKNWNFTTVLEAFAKERGISKSKLKKTLGESYEEALEDFVIRHAERICRIAALDEGANSQAAIEFKKRSMQQPNDVMRMDKGDGAKPNYFKNGQLILFVSDRLMNVDGRLTFSRPISDIWDDVLPNDLHNEGGVELKKGKKPEKLIARILELCTKENDLVLDFFAGTGTTGAVAMKMNRRFILCEQMDYIEDKTCQRLKNTIDGDTRGVSSNYNWQGGGSFVYCELMKQNQSFVDKIQAAETTEHLQKIYKEIVSTGFISYKIDPSKVDKSAKDYDGLSFDEKKRFLMEILDKNLLYVNYCDMADAEFEISEVDKEFTKSFYMEK